MTLVRVTGAPVLAHMRAAFPEGADWVELSSCPVCGRSDAVRDVGLVEGADHVEPGAPEAHALGPVMSVCLDCEHGFIRRRPRRAWFDDYYARDWDRGGQEAFGRKRVRADFKVADFAGSSLEPGSAVLDVGAGFGKQVLGFLERGHRPRGLERSEHRARFVRDVLGVPCDSRPLEAFETTESLDLVYLNHVLEHVDDAAEALGRARELLAESGLLYVAVPNLWAEHPPQTFHFVPHLSAFTLRSLERLLRGAGFAVVRAQEGNELQVLARKVAAPDEHALDRSPPSARERFWSRIGDWVGRAFPSDPAPRVLIWGPSEREKHTYDARSVASGRLRYLLMRAVHRSRESMAGRLLDERVPSYLTSDRLRMLPVRASDGAGLPVRVVHPSAEAPVWVK